MIKQIPVTKQRKEQIIEQIKRVKYSINWPIQFFIYANIVLYFLYFFHKIFW